MNKVLMFLLCVLSLVAINNFAFGQEPEMREEINPPLPMPKEHEAEENLTLQETREARLLIDKFQKTLAETMSLREAVQESGSSKDLEKLVIKIIPEMGDLGINEDVMKNNNSQLVRLYLAGLDLLYLCEINYHSFKSLRENATDKEDEFISEQIKMVLVSNPNLSQAFADNGKFGIENSAQLYEIIDTVERAVTAMRNYVKRQKISYPAEFKRGITELEKECTPKFALKVYEKDDKELPEGTRAVEIRFGSFFIVLAKIDDEMKILMIVPNSD